LEQDLAKAQTEADKVAALVAQVNTLKPKADRVQGLEQDLAKAQTEADKVPALVAQVKTAQEQVQKTTEKLNVLTQKYEAFKEKAQGVVGEQNQKIAELIGELEEAKKPVLHQEAPVPEKTPREVFLALYGHLKTVLVGLIDGMRLDAVEGRLGLFSSHSRSGPRVQVLCDVPENKVMPKIGEVFDSRAIPGKGKGGIGD
jgi:septal ring factor EnvC (AmiA/AmiB activator)